MQLRIGHLSTLYHTSIVMMAHREILSGFPARIKWSLFGTGPAIVNAFRENEIDLAYIGLPPAVIGILSGVRIRCIAGGHIEGTVIASHKDSYHDTDNLGTILSGFSSIGVPGKGSIHDLILMDIRDRYNPSLTVMNFRWADEVLEAFVKNKVDAVIGTPALAQAVVEYGDGKIIYPSSKLWPCNPSYGILVREELMEGEGKEILREFLLRHERATLLLREDREALSGEIASFMGVVDRDFVLNTLNISPRYCAALSDGFIRCTMDLAARQKDLGYIDREVSKEEVFDLSLINEIHPEPPHY